MQRDQRRAGHYEWFSGFLKARGVARTVRLAIAGTALSMAGALLVLLTGAGGPQGQVERAMMLLAVGGGVAGTALWLWRWPTRAQSAAFAVVTSLSIALACVAYPDPLAGLLGCIAFTTIGAYAAFFHSTRLVLGMALFAIAVALSQAVELAGDGRPALASVDFFLVIQANIAMPVAIHALLRALRGDLVDADLDPLTGLLNRRAFRRLTLSLFDGRAQDGYLMVALLDLDDFKGLNDAHGHLVGDQALVAVADALRATATPTAVIARSGGEEFLIADVVPSAEAAQRCQRVCDAIAELHTPVTVTASLGTAVAALDGLAPRGRDDVVDHLITAADMAMYRAKRNGGNQCHHHGVWASPGSA
ncbi:diguanylate cyclase [Mycobacterium sp. NAZ190054]|uniref:GGDEF domain-containing protein n=1 Tax=Mycobacterium sp. NAZ190054 TaxID=1747766 RepID=UPI000794B8AF|nr:GGDEF domain-containing protein [Mycobacterium sp. NAZ190054]KWX68842.1 diguanylate cyclase [Mycobacterium sp. NAZ190054]